VNRKETGGDHPSTKAFDGSRKPSSIKQYTEVWLKLLRYIWRTATKENRPKYKLTKHQRYCLSNLHTAAADEDPDEGENGRGWRKSRRERGERVEDACLEFWIAMFDQDLQDDEYESGIISGLALVGMTQGGGRRWRLAIEYTPDLSGIVTVLRALVVYNGRRRRQEAIKDGKSRGLTQEEAEGVAPTILQTVKGSVHDFMTLTAYGGRVTPLNRVLQQRTYGRRIRETTKASTRVAWAGEKILIDKVGFSIEDVRTVVFGLRETARRRLFGELMFVDESGGGEGGVPALEIKSLVDDMSCAEEGWSFLVDGRNKFAEDGEEWMIRRVCKEERLSKIFVQKGQGQKRAVEKIEWNQRGIEGYFRQVRQFKEELFALVHLSAGAPARGTELITVMHRNPQQGRGQRGVFIDDGMVVFATSYHKNYQHSKTKKPIQRYLPQEVGELLVYYLWLVEPFVRMIQLIAREQVESSEFI
jgi:hypothetical protein